MDAGFEFINAELQYDWAERKCARLTGTPRLATRASSGEERLAATDWPPNVCS